jgi:hypothetical protein
VAAFSAERSVAWSKDDPFGVEFADLRLGRDTLTASGVAIGTEPVPYRLDYELETGPRFVTTRLHVTSRGEGWRRDLDLRRDASGAWTVDATEHGTVDLPSPGCDASLLEDALDCDLGLSPVTNMMPILRHGLVRAGGPIVLSMAWVAVPELSVRLDRQRYRHVRSHVVGFEAVDGSFAAELTCDDDGVVVDYPGIARRLGP